MSSQEIFETRYSSDETTRPFPSKMKETVIIMTSRHIKSSTRPIASADLCLWLDRYPFSRNNPQLDTVQLSRWKYGTHFINTPFRNLSPPQGRLIAGCLLSEEV